MDLLLDTNIIIIYGRNNDDAQQIELEYQIFSEGNRLFVSVVTLGEIDGFSKKMNLGERRRQMMTSLLEKVTVTDIHYHELIEAYGDLHAFTSGKVEVQVSKSKFSARNMGKNDLWIAATAKAYNLKLVTTDKDFLILDGEQIDVLYIDRDKLLKKS